MDQDYSYSFEWDSRYCYPKSNVLKNKLGITNGEDLQSAEREITAVRMAVAQVNGIPGAFDLKHLQEIHKYLFSDIYEWAGQFRQVDISKGNSFCHWAFIETQANELFAKLQKELPFKGLSQDEVAKRLSFYLGEINVLHPFREGNGRSQRLFVQLLAQELGYSLDFSKITPREMIIASAESFACKYSKMDAIFQKVISPLPSKVQEVSLTQDHLGEEDAHEH